MVLLDGLYANGPIMAACKHNHWDFMIVLGDDALPSVWEEFEALRKLEPNQRYEHTWGDRRQTFRWVNHIAYRYGSNNRHRLVVHLVVCQERWQEIDPETNQPVTKTAKHAWLSPTPFNARNLHERCNLGARHRWGIEEALLVEKRHGYQYEHCFSTNWNAMRGYHYLMRIGHALNVLTQYASALVPLVRALGVRGFIDFLWQTMAAPWLDPATVRERLAQPYQLRLA
jgi:hypothetical protein